MKSTLPTIGGLAQTLLACLPLLLAGTLVGVPSVVYAEWQTANPTATEIWMSGTGVALWRRVPQDRAAVHPDNHDFARSMLRAARDRADLGDRQTAEWLAKWAHRLTNEQGTVGGDEFCGQQNRAVPAALGLWRGAHAEPIAGTADSHLETNDDHSTTQSDSAKRVVLRFRPGQDHDSVAGAFSDERNNTRRSNPASVASRVLQVDATPVVTLSADGDSGSGPPVVDVAETDPSPTGPDESTVGPSTEPLAAAAAAEPTQTPRGARTAAIDGAPRQNAAVSGDIDSGDLAGPDDRHYHPRSGDQPITITAVRSAGDPVTTAVISFAAGIVSCAAICLALCFLPFRPAVDRRVEIRSPTEREPPAPCLPAIDRHDKGNRIVEEFFDRNVELYQELTRTG